MTKTRKCKYCKSVFSPITTLQKNCFEPNCVAEWINEVKEKNWKRKKAKLKMDLMTVQDYVKLIDELKEIIATYKKKCKELEK